MTAQGSAAHQAPLPSLGAPAGASVRRRVPAGSKMRQIGIPGRQNP
jgi:hypothetical protein